MSERTYLLRFAFPKHSKSKNEKIEYDQFIMLNYYFTSTY